MELTGRVQKKRFAVGTKSERDAVVLVTDTGEFVLRRAGGNPFQDSILDGLIGSTIHAMGEVCGYSFIMNRWREVDDRGALLGGPPAQK